VIHIYIYIYDISSLRVKSIKKMGMAYVDDCTLVIYVMTEDQLVRVVRMACCVTCQ